MRQKLIYGATAVVLTKSLKNVVATPVQNVRVISTFLWID